MMALVSAALLALYAATLADLAALSIGSRYYSHVPLVPLFSAWVAWTGRRYLPPVGWDLRPAGGALLAAALLILAFGTWLDSLTVRVLSLPLAVGAGIVLALGIPGLRRLAFPVAFLALMAPLPTAALARVSLVMQDLATTVTHGVLTALAIPVARDGLSLHLEAVTLDITEECNGLRFLFTMAVVGTAVAWALRGRAGHRVLIVGLALVSAVVANLLRVAGTALLADLAGADAVTGLPHLVWGKAVYAVLFVAFTLAALTLRRPTPPLPRPTPTSPAR
jgi:exosortase